MFIRFIGTVTEEGDPYGDLTFDYFQVFRHITYDIRMVMFHGGHCDFEEEVQRWHPFRNNFTMPLEEPYINVVCGDLGLLERAWTKGVPNVAIVPSSAVEEWLKNGCLEPGPGHSPSPSPLPALPHRYDACFTSPAASRDVVLSILQSLQ